MRDELKIYKLNDRAYVLYNEDFYTKVITNWDTFLNSKNLFEKVVNDLESWEITDEGFLSGGLLDPPLGNQEIWAAGVTYERSKSARMSEAKESGGDVFYDKVYDADRPELFFKATPERCVGHGDVIHIRRDSSWNVPEPELTLFVNSGGVIQGYTIGNDVSSRDIEGENPLYLPQAKVFEKCASIGPCLYVPKTPISSSTTIHIEIKRGTTSVYEDSVAISRMKRNFEELVSYLFRECQFRNGVFLMTGTCLVPPDNFTLLVGDTVTITIEGIGKIVNQVSKMKTGDNR